MASEVNNDSLEVAKKLTMNLPWEIDVRLIEKYPKMARFLVELSKQISPLGCSLKLAKQLEEAKKEMTAKKAKFLRNYIIYDELQSLCDDVSVDDNSTILGNLNKFVVRAQTVAGLNTVIRDGPILQMNAAALETATIKPDPKFTKKLSSILYNRLMEVCNKRMIFYKISGENDENPTNIFEFSDVVLKDLQKIEQRQKELKLMQVERQWQSIQYEKMLTHVVDLLHLMATKFRLHNPSDFYVQKTDQLSIKAKALNMKIRVLQAEILCDTYSNATVPALQKISNNLEHETLLKESLVSDLTRALQEYSKLGKEFADLVQEYKEIKDLIETQKWALNKVKNK